MAMDMSIRSAALMKLAAAQRAIKVDRRRAVKGGGAADKHDDEEAPV